MKIKTHLLLLITLVLTITSCVSKRKYEKVKAEKETLDSIIPNGLRLTNEVKKLGIAKKYGNIDFKEERTLSFNINMDSKDEQIIHLSSDNDKIPFMLVCKVATEKINDQRKITDLKIAVRSIGKSAPTFFKIVGIPILEKYENNNFNYILKADIDLNTSTTRRSPAIHNSLVVNKNERIEVEINPKKLKESLLSQYKSMEEKDNKILKLLNDLEAICCFGVICQLQIVY